MAGSAVFRGNEALERGTVTRHELQRYYRPIFPGVYARAGQQLALRDRCEAAWLWSRRRGVIAGIAASGLHGAQWVDADATIDLVCANSHPPHGIQAHEQVLADDEVVCVAGLPVTNLLRTAYDLGRLLPRAAAVTRLDALTRATPFSTDGVLRLAERYPAARGIRKLRGVLASVDGGAASPKESELRLLLVDAGLPAPRTQIPIVVDFHTLAVLDMGWTEFGVAVEYDGDHHRTDRGQYVRDRRRIRKLEELGWIVIRVIAEDKPHEIIERVRRALLTRGWRPPRTGELTLAG